MTGWVRTVDTECERCGHGFTDITEFPEQPEVMSHYVDVTCPKCGHDYVVDLLAEFEKLFEDNE